MNDSGISDLKQLFGDLDSTLFRKKFRTKNDCLEILADAKWSKGFVCRSCGNERYCQGPETYSRRCTRCKKTESATSHTIFHHCRIDLPTAFEIAFLVCSKPSIPASELSHVLETRHMTCLNFKKQVLNCLQSDGNLLK